MLVVLVGWFGDGVGVVIEWFEDGVVMVRQEAMMEVVLERCYY